MGQQACESMEQSGCRENPIATETRQSMIRLNNSQLCSPPRPTHRRGGLQRPPSWEQRRAGCSSIASPADASRPPGCHTGSSFKEWVGKGGLPSRRLLLHPALRGTFCPEHAGGQQPLCSPSLSTGKSRHPPGDTSVLLGFSLYQIPWDKNLGSVAGQPFGNVSGNYGLSFWNVQKGKSALWLRGWEPGLWVCQLCVTHRLLSLCVPYFPPPQEEDYKYFRGTLYIFLY